MLDERRLARAVLTEDGDGLARLDRERDAAHRLDAVRIAMDQVLDINLDRRPVGPGPSPCRHRGPRADADAARSRSRSAPGVASRAAAMADSSNSWPGATPARTASRTRVGGRSPTVRPPRGPRRAVEGDGLPSSSTRHRSIRPSTVGACSRTGSSSRNGQAVEEVCDRGCPGRVELRGRLVEDEDVRAHRDDARDGDTLLLAADSENGRSARLPMARRSRTRRCAGPSPAAGRRGSRARTRAPRGPSASTPRAGSRRREHDPDATEQRLASAVAASTPAIITVRRRSPARHAG